MRGGESSRRLHAFTLIEMMAVVMILALTMAIVIPNLSATRGTRLNDTALELAGHIELARERAVATGAPHRMLIDLETGDFSLDWWVTETRANAAYGIDNEEEAVPPPIHGAFPGADLLGDGPEISLSPPTDDTSDYFPIPGRFGRTERLPDDYFFEGVTTPEGWIDEGEVQIVFEWDGTSDFAEIVLMDSWDNSLILEVQPLLEAVRIVEDDVDG